MYRAETYLEFLESDFELPPFMADDSAGEKITRSANIEETQSKPSNYRDRYAENREGIEI